MNPTRPLRRRWFHYALTLGGLTLLGAVVLAEGARKPAAKRDAKGPARMVEAIANRNKPPKLVWRRRGWPRKVALFPEGYDWKEDKRVLKALDELFRDRTVELWEELVRREKKDDRRYCVTLVSSNCEDARIESVGDVCSRLAYARLLDVFEQHLPDNPYKPGRISLKTGIENLAEWRKERAKKSLYQLQIEVCENALRELAKVEGVSEKEKAKARKKTEAEIKKLRETKKPVLVEYEGFWHPDSEYQYKPERAKRVREAVRKGSSEHIEFIK
jgi:hypothetical protein